MDRSWPEREGMSPVVCLLSWLQVVGIGYPIVEMIPVSRIGRLLNEGFALAPDICAILLLRSDIEMMLVPVAFLQQGLF